MIEHRPGYVPGDGNDKADIVFLGEAPGKDEAAQGKPFIGYSGSFFRGVLADIGLPASKVWIDNVCHYRPPGNNIHKFFKNYRARLPSIELAEGMAELYVMLAHIQPKVVVPLGNTALWALCGVENISKRRGSIMSINWDMQRTIALDHHKLLSVEVVEAIGKITGTKVIPTYHPAYIARQYNDLPIFVTDLKRIQADSRFPELRLPQRKFYIDPDEIILHDLWKKLRAASVLAYDIECVGHKLYCVGFACDPSWGLTLTADDPLNMQIIRDLLESDIPKVAQNGLFDKSFLMMNTDIKVKNYCFDTMYAHHLVYPEFSQGLDFLCSIYTREPYYKDEGKDWNSKEAEDVQRFLEYNTKDVMTTLEIWQNISSNELTKDPRYGAMFEQMMKEVPVYIDMGVHGIRVDLNEMKRLADKYEIESLELQQALDQAIIDSLSQELKRGISDPGRFKAVFSFLQEMGKGLGTLKGGFNVYSPKMVKNYLYDIRGMKVKTKRNADGTTKPTADEDALKELYGETGDKFLLTIVKIREKRKRISSYLNVKTMPDGHTYFNMKPTGTETNRSSCGMTTTRYGLNFQTVPHELRSCYIAEPGYMLAYIDFSQAEARVVAYKAGVRKMIAAFEHPNPKKYTESDVHSLTAHEVLGVPYSEIQEYPHRYLAKTCNHAFNYEMGPIKFWKRVMKDAEETGVRITRSEASKMRKAHFRAYPELEWYWEWVRNELRTNKRTIVNPFGHVRRFSGRLDDDTFRSAFSHYAQSTVACLLRRSMARVHNELVLPYRNQYPRTRIIIEVHDALLVHFPEESLHDFVPKAEQLMRIPIPINGRDIYIPTDAAVGYNWGDRSESNPRGLASYERT